MRLWEAHHCESHHGERINTAFAEILHPTQSSELILVPVYERLNFLTAMSVETFQFVSFVSQWGLW